MFLNFLVPFQLFFEGSLGSLCCLFSIAFAFLTCFRGMAWHSHCWLWLLRHFWVKKILQKNSGLIWELVAATGAFRHAAFQHHVTEGISKWLLFDKKRLQTNLPQFFAPDIRCVSKSSTEDSSAVRSASHTLPGNFRKYACSLSCGQTTLAILCFLCEHWWRPRNYQSWSSYPRRGKARRSVLVQPWTKFHVTYCFWSSILGQYCLDSYLDQRVSIISFLEPRTNTNWSMVCSAWEIWRIYQRSVKSS